MDTITIAAGSEVLGETLTLQADPAWFGQIRQLAPFVVYGERYDRAVIDTLRDVSDLCRRANGDQAWIKLAHKRLTWCVERKGL